MIKNFAECILKMLCSYYMSQLQLLQHQSKPEQPTPPVNERPRSPIPRGGSSGTRGALPNTSVNKLRV